MNFFMPFNHPMMNLFNPFVMPNFNIFTPMNYYNNAYYASPSNSIFTSNVKRSSNISRPQTTTVKSTPKISKQDKPYNKVNGQKLAKKIVENLPNDRDPKNPLCAKYVKEAVEDCGLGEYIKGNGAHCKYVFRANPNFKEIQTFTQIC